jgi:hypothetical protein
MIYLTLPELLRVADWVLGDYDMRDVGLLESALARPRSTAFGHEAYVSLDEKAAALLHSFGSQPRPDRREQAAWARRDDRIPRAQRSAPDPDQ